MFSFFSSLPEAVHIVGIVFVDLLIIKRLKKDAHFCKNYNPDILADNLLKPNYFLIITDVVLRLIKFSKFTPSNLIKFQQNIYVYGLKG